MAIITLTTDYGYDDHYVGAIKGVIYQIFPSATVVDITHQITPQEVLGAAMVLKEIWRAFPKGTVHVAVVDPGVGSARQILVGRYAGQMFVVPDNGLLTFVHQAGRPEQINMVTNSSLFCHPVSETFHGRDIIAPVAGHLAKGLAQDSVGPETDSIVTLKLPQVQQNPDGRLVGQVIHVDHFGNLITNITYEKLVERADFSGTREAFIKGTSVGALKDHYGQVPVGQPCALIGSNGFLEIAVNQGSAAGVLGAGIGTVVEVG